MSASILELVEQTCRVMQGSLAFCPDDLPGYRDLVATILDEQAARLVHQAGGPHLPWLTLPLLVFEALTREALTGKALDGEDRLPATYHVAAAWELGNMAAAQLDAWQDQDTDGALWQRIGPGPAVNLAVGLLALSFQTLSHLAKGELLPLSAVLDLKREFEHTLLQMTAGQHADLGDDLDLEGYESVAVAKTGSLFRLACWSGAVVAGAPADVAGRYGTFGEALGLLIQAWNDLYGLEGAMGKRDVGHQRTLPTLASLALANGTGTAGETPAPAALEQGSKLYVVMQAALLHQRAATALARCPAPGRLTRFLDAYSVGQLVAGGKGTNG